MTACISRLASSLVEAKGETSEEARRLMHAVIELTRMWAES